MTEDHYATLGVEPRSEAAAIRAAYLALMHRYHPDKNDSPAAVERAHAIIAAFAVLGDVERRLHYDWGRRRAAEAAEAAQRPWRGWAPRAIMVVGGALLLVAIMAMLPDEAPTPPAARVADVRDKIAQPAAAELPASFVAPPAAPLESEPVVAPQAIDIAPDQVAAPLPVEVSRVAVPDRRPVRAVARPKAAPPRIKATCRLARAGAEAAICNDDNLNALDGHVMAFYNQSLIFGTAAKRSALVAARGNFLARREACHTADCLRTLHLAHLREMAAIVENRSASPSR